MAEPPRRTNLASGSSAYPDNIEREIAARRDDVPVPRAEATANIRVETATSGADDSAIVAEPRRRKGIPLVFIAGGAGAVLVAAVVAIVALRGGSSDDGKPKRVSANDTNSATRNHELPDTTDSRRTGDTPGNGSAMRIEDGRAKPASGVAMNEPAPAPTPEPVVEPAPPTPTPPEPPPAPVIAPKKTPTLGGKKVVLEYDTAAPKEVPKKAPVASPKDDSASIGAARITYFNGNRKLFAGDADAAIKLYKQALAVYPGYVAGYRGLGLAYAQKGDKANALKSFRTYLNAVPGAKDAALVRKRIQTLQK